VEAILQVDALVHLFSELKQSNPLTSFFIQACPGMPMFDVGPFLEPLVYEYLKATDAECQYCIRMEAARRLNKIEPLDKQDSS